MLHKSSIDEICYIGVISAEGEYGRVLTVLTHCVVDAQGSLHVQLPHEENMFEDATTLPN